MCIRDRYITLYQSRTYNLAAIEENLELGLRDQAEFTRQQNENSYVCFLFVVHQSINDLVNLWLQQRDK